MKLSKSKLALVLFGSVALLTVVAPIASASPGYGNGYGYRCGYYGNGNYGNYDYGYGYYGNGGCW